jgi:hypothetical protein
VKKLWVLAALLPSTALAAEGVTIDIRLDHAAYRTSPQPRPTRSHTNFYLLLLGDGTVQELSGRRNTYREKESQLGRRFRVVDENTIERRLEYKDRINVLTIAVSGKTCTATMRNELKPGFTEWEGTSTELGVTAKYRDWTMTGSTCRIR